MGLTRVLLEAERQLRGDRAGDADGLSRRARSFRGQRYEPEKSGRTQDTARSCHRGRPWMDLPAPRRWDDAAPVPCRVALILSSLAWTHRTCPWRWIERSAS